MVARDHSVRLREPYGLLEIKIRVSSYQVSSAVTITLVPKVIISIIKMYLGTSEIEQALALHEIDQFLLEGINFSWIFSLGPFLPSHQLGQHPQSLNELGEQKLILASQHGLLPR